MSRKFESSAYLVGGLITALGCLLGAGIAQSRSPQETNAGTAPKAAAQAFKNIQVLKDIPADQLFPAMQFVSASLGVECDYCHVERAFDKDDKEKKQVARRMMQMMFALNKDNFNGRREVTCYSCHHGSPEPAGTPAIADEEPRSEHRPGEAPAATPALPSADELLQKYAQAVGGADALQKVSSRVEKGTITAFGGRNFPVEVIT